MAVFRVEKSSNYTVMANYHLDDRNLSLKARGLLSTMLRLPDNWDYTIAGLSTVCREGRDGIQNTLNELIDAGYIVRRRSRNGNGSFTGIEYIVYEQPQPKADGQQPEDAEPEETQAESASPYPSLPDMARPDAGNPDAGNPQQSSTNIPSTKLNNTPIAPKRGRRREPIEHESYAYRGAQYLDAKICARLPDKPPADERTLQRWAADIERINRIDGYEWALISRVLKYSQSDEFWQRNILSGAKLRSKFVMLMSHMGKGPAPPGQQKTFVVESQEVEEW